MTYRPQTDPTDLFKRAVKEYVQSKDTARVELAAAFEVSMTTVDRWWLGTARPHPLLINQVMKWIASKT